MTDVTYISDPTSSTISFDRVLDGLEAITDGTISNPQGTTCIITVNTDVGLLVAVLTGTGFFYSGTGADLGLAGGTITKISLSLNGQHQGDVTGALPVDDIVTAVVAEESGDASAIEHFFMSFNWTYVGNDIANNVPPDLVIGNDNVLFNPTGNDHISLGGGDDVFYSGDGNDTIDTGTGYDQVFAGNGNDTITVGVNAFVDAGDGDDTITTAVYSTSTPGSFVDIHGGGGGDTINAHTAGNYHGDAGDDRLISYDSGDDDGNFMVVDYSQAEAGIIANLTATGHDGLDGGNNSNGFGIADGQGGTDLVSNFTTFNDSGFGDKFYVDSNYTSLYGTWVQINLSGGDDHVEFDGVAVGRIGYYNSVGGPVLADLAAGTATDLNDGDDYIGNDTFIGATQFRGTSFDDEIYGSNIDGVLIRGETGNDFIKGGSGAEYLDGDDRGGIPDLAGDDTLVGGAGDDTLDGNNGYDVVDYSQDGGENGVTVNLTAGQAIDSFGDTDTLIGIEQVNGTDLADTMKGAVEGSYLFGNGGNDTLYTGAYDAVNRPSTFSFLDGGDGNDILNGYGPGYFSGGAGNDRLIGHQTGDDDGNFMFAVYDTAQSGIVANFTGSEQEGVAGGDNANGYHVSDGLGGTDTIINFIGIQGSGNDDHFFADLGAFTSFYGQRLQIQPGAGNDTIVVTGTSGTAIGIVSYFNGSIQGGVLANLREGTATDLDPSDNFVGSDTLSGVNGFRGTSYDDVVYGSDAGVNIRGETGNDAIYGGAGDDYLDGDDLGGNPTLTGNDTIFGGGGHDILLGNNGNDILVGGTGIDRIDGGAGTDVASLAGLHGGGFDIIQAGGIVYAMDGVDHSYDVITNVEGFWGLSQAIGLGDVRTFDALAYAASYDDLARAFRTDGDAALSHYVAGGFFEGRHDSFDAAQYLANYAGLRAAFGDDTHAATLHFLAGGVDEHRLAEDPLDYIASYADLIGAFHGHSQAELQAMGIAHYQAAGNAEGRRDGIDFDADQYLANYAGLRAAFGDDDDAAATHFINGGYFEHRLAENPLEYIASYADLIGAFHGQTESQMRASGIAHYQAGGFAEGREADFDVDQYLANYADLRAAFADGHGGYDEDAAIYHYIAGGYDEGRTDHVLMA